MVKEEVMVKGRGRGEGRGGMRGRGGPGRGKYGTMHFNGCVSSRKLMGEE